MPPKFEFFENRKDTPEIPTFKFSIPKEERSKSYEELILPGLEKNIRAELKEEMQRQYFALMEYLRWMGSMDPAKSNSSEADIIAGAENFADCIAKFNAGMVSEEETADWFKEEQFWHRKFEDSVKKLPTILVTELQPEEDSQKRIELLCEEDHKFFNEFALFVACQQVFGKSDGREKVPIEKQ